MSSEPLAIATSDSTDTMREVSCPACGHSHSEIEYPLTQASIVRCLNCGQHYVTPLPSDEALEEKLQHWAEVDVVDSERLSIAFDSATLDLFASFIDHVNRHAEYTRGRMLDVGCATGALLQVAKDDGWNAQGIEIGEASARYAREELGLPVECGSLFDMSYQPGEFDAVSMVEVIEHLQSPGAALQQLHQWIKPGGLLLVTTPNYNALFRRLFGTRWWVVNCEDEHIVLFTPATLARLLEQRGFVVEYQQIRGMDFVGLAKALRETFSRKRPDSQAPGAAETGYYELREDKQRVKQLFQRVGLLKAARGLLAALNHLFSLRWSPVYGWGEQIVVVARRVHTDSVRN